MHSKIRKLRLKINLHSSREEVMRDWDIVKRWGLEQSLNQGVAVAEAIYLVPVTTAGADLSHPGNKPQQASSGKREGLERKFKYFSFLQSQNFCSCPKVEDSLAKVLPPHVPKKE